MAVDRLGINQIHEAEAARIMKAQAKAALGPQQDMIMGLGDWSGRSPWFIDAETARHAEMREPDQAVIEADQQVLAAPLDVLNLPPGEPFRQSRRQWEAQVGTPLLNVRDPLSGQRGEQAAADGFDLGKLRHERQPSA
jgi:hypothetical protein